MAQEGRKKKKKGLRRSSEAKEDESNELMAETGESYGGAEDFLNHDDHGQYSVPLADLKGANAGEGESFGGSKVEYNPRHTMTNLFRYKGTVLVGLWKRPIVILSVLMYVGTSICKHGYDEQCGQHLPIISLSDLSTAGTLVTFFLSFYATSCYGRFLDQYTHLKDIEGIARAIAVKAHI